MPADPLPPPDDGPHDIFTIDTWQARLLDDLTRAYLASGRMHAEVLDALGRCRRVHLALMREPWASHVADGSKVVESRWGKVRCAPHDSIEAGDVIAWKRTGGPVFGVSCVVRARTRTLRDDAHVAELVAAHHAAIRIPNDPAPYLGKRVLTLIHVGPFVPTPSPIVCRQPGRAGWIVVNDRGVLHGH